LDDVGEEKKGAAMDAHDVKFLDAKLEILVVFDALFAKRILTYADMHEAIARCREGLPTGEPYKSLFNIMEQKYQHGPYQSPLAAPGDPQP
jgi:hypothetical protein